MALGNYFFGSVFLRTKVTTRYQKLSLLWNPRAWDYIYMKQDFLAKKFSLLTLSTVECSSGYLLLYPIWQFVSELIECTCINTRKSRPQIREKLHHCQRAKKCDEHGTSFLSSPRLICIQWKFTTPDQLASPSAPLIKVLLIINILLFLDFWGIHLFRSNRYFQGTEFVDQPILEKL